MISKPRNRAFDDPAVSISAQRPAILGSILGAAVAAVGRDHFDAQVEQERIQRVGVVALVADEALGLAFVFKKRERLLHHLWLTHVGGCHAHAERNPLAVNGELDFGSFAFARQPDGIPAALGRGKGRIDEALVDLQLASFQQFANQGREQLAEAVALTPALQMIVHRGLGRKALRQKAPLHARVQHEQDRFKHLARICRRAPQSTRSFYPQVRINQRPLLICNKHMDTTVARTSSSDFSDNL